MRPAAQALSFTRLPHFICFTCAGMGRRSAFGGRAAKGRRDASHRIHDFAAQAEKAQKRASMTGVSTKENAENLRFWRLARKFERFCTQGRARMS